MNQNPKERATEPEETGGNRAGENQKAARDTRAAGAAGRKMTGGKPTGRPREIKHGATPGSTKNKEVNQKQPRGKAANGPAPPKRKTTIWGRNNPKNHEARPKTPLPWGDLQYIRFLSFVNRRSLSS
jgi:hypothetical protein